MKITFEIQETELNEIIVQQIKEQSILFFQKNKDSFVKDAFNSNLKSLKGDGFFKRQVSSTLNKAIYDKVNREFAEYIEDQLQKHIDNVFKSQDLNKKMNDLVDKKVKEKLRELLDK
ncbi:hypothetical protein D3C87_1062990 [compost metagenome]